MALSGFVVFDGRAVNQKNVHPAVVVVVERGGAAALGFHDVELSPGCRRSRENQSRPPVSRQPIAVDLPWKSSRPAFVRPPRALPLELARRSTGLWRSRLPRSVQYQCHQQDGHRHHDAQVSHRRYR